MDHISYAKLVIQEDYSFTPILPASVKKGSRLYNGNAKIYVVMERYSHSNVMMEIFLTVMGALRNARHRKAINAEEELLSPQVYVGIKES